MLNFRWSEVQDFQPKNLENALALTHAVVPPPDAYPHVGRWNGSPPARRICDAKFVQSLSLYIVSVARIRLHGITKCILIFVLSIQLTKG